MLDRGQTGGDRERTDVDSFDRVTVPEAAARLGLSESAIYKRIQRGRFKYETERDDDGRLWIYLPAVDSQDTEDTGETVQDTPGSTETVAELRARIDSLEAELARLWEAYETLQDDYRDEQQRADMILLEAIRRTPALESGHVQPREDIGDTGETPPRRGFWQWLRDIT